MNTKKRALLLGLAVALLVVVPAAAGKRVGDQINVLGGFPSTFAAADPFYVEHGFGGINPKDHGPVSGYLFQLEVDGVYMDHSFKETTVSKDEDNNVIQRIVWIINFPDGLSAGFHTFTGHWFSPCKQTGDECDRPNRPIEVLTLPHTVEFTE